MDVQQKTFEWKRELDAATVCRFALNDGADIRQAISTYGIERVSLVLTHTVRNVHEMTDYPKEVSEWAMSQKRYRLPPGHRQGPSRFRELELDLPASTITEMVLAIMEYERTHQKSVKEYSR